MHHEEKNLSFKEIVWQLTEFKINFKFNYFNFNLIMSTTENYPKRIIFVSGYGYRSHDEVEKLERFALELSHKYIGSKVITNHIFYDTKNLTRYAIFTKEDF